MTSIPDTQYAVQLIGPDELTLNTAKPVHQPGPHQILMRTECVGLCFSDLKLLKQFSKHVRKGPVIKGIDPAVLDALPSYVPGEKPTVPGHEAIAEIIAIGEGVTQHEVGERVLVQADWRELRTAESNGAFGYDFEGALGEYILLDERVVIEPSTAQRYLLPVGGEQSSSALALVEPWACVEDSYVTPERQSVLPGGKLLVVVAEGYSPAGLDKAQSAGPAGEITQAEPGQVADLPDEAFDDIITFGVDRATVEALCDKLAPQGIFNIVQCGRTFGEPVAIDVGRVHYGMCRWIGTTGCDAGESYATIPPDGELHDGDKVLIVGAGGPMGQMHVIRVLTAGRKDLYVVGTDFDSPRLASLESKARPVAEANGCGLCLVNPQEEDLDGAWTYTALMAPIPALVAQAIADSDEGGRINIFAGIPAGTRHELDLDTYIARKQWMFGTSGSTIRDMQLVLEKVESGQMDTNVSVDAISGMAGAIDGIRAVENRTMAGKILVYPQLHETPLIPLAELGEHYPSVAEKLTGGVWTRQAEQELLKVGR